MNERNKVKSERLRKLMEETFQDLEYMGNGVYRLPIGGEKQEYKEYKEVDCAYEKCDNIVIENKNTVNVYRSKNQPIYCTQRCKNLQETLDKARGIFRERKPYGKKRKDERYPHSRLKSSPKFQQHNGRRCRQLEAIMKNDYVIDEDVGSILMFGVFGVSMGVAY